MSSAADTENLENGDDPRNVDENSLLETARGLVAIAGELSDLKLKAKPASHSSSSLEVSSNRVAAQSLYKDRRLRDDIFDSSELFGEPAWDILLDLYVSGREGKTVSVTSACIAAAVPTTTGLRYVGKLEENGLIRRTADSRDGRRALLSLTDRAHTLLEVYLAKCSFNRRSGAG